MGKMLFPNGIGTRAILSTILIAGWIWNEGWNNPTFTGITAGVIAHYFSGRDVSAAQGAANGRTQ